MKIELVHNQSPLLGALQAFVQKHQLVFNSAAWLQNYPKDNICQCAILNNNNEVIGCFTYYQFKRSIFNFIISPPFAPHIGLYYVNPSVSIVGRNSFDKDIIDTVATYFNGLAAHYIDINLSEQLVDTQPFTWKGFSAVARYSYLLDLSQTEEELWNNLSSEKRKSINKANKDGLVISETTDMKLVHSLIAQSLSRNQLYKNTGVLQSILFNYAKPGNAFAFVAQHNHQPIGATFCLQGRNKAIYLFGGFDSGNKHHGAGVSCMWQSILKAKASGLPYFDFEGSMNPSIERYFREFGGKLVPYYNLQKTKPLLKLLLSLKK